MTPRAVPKRFIEETTDSRRPYLPGRPASRTAPFLPGLVAIGIFLSFSCLPCPAREADKETAPFELDAALEWQGPRYGTLGPTGRRLFAVRVDERPGLAGVFGYLFPAPGFRDPAVLSFRDEKGPLALKHQKTIWRPSHLEVRWVIEGKSKKEEARACPRPQGEGSGSGDGEILVIERKFITGDDALVDRVRVVNGTARPAVLEAVVTGAMTPLPERFRSRQVNVDLSKAANITPCPGGPLFTAGEAPAFSWVEGEAAFYASAPAGPEPAAAASAGTCLGRGFGGRVGDEAVFVIVRPSGSGNDGGTGGGERGGREKRVRNSKEGGNGGGGPCLFFRYARAEGGAARFRLAVGGEAKGEIVFPSTGGGGGRAGDWKIVRAAPEGFAPGLCRVTLTAAKAGSAVKIDGLFAAAEAFTPPNLPAAGRFPAGLMEEQIPYLPGSVDYDAVRYFLPDPEPGAKPTLAALRGGNAGDPAFSLPESVLVEMPRLEHKVTFFHLLCLVAGPRGFGRGSPAAFTFFLDDGGKETVPFPDPSRRLAPEGGGGDRAAGPDRNAGTDRPAGAGGTATSPATGPEEFPRGGGAANDRAFWRFLVLPRITAPCVRLSYTPPPGRFVEKVLFRKSGEEGVAVEIPVLMAITAEIPPPSGRLPLYLGRRSFHGFPVSLALAGEGFTPIRTAEGRRALLRSLQLDAGEAAEFSLVLATGRRDDEAAYAALDEAREPEPLGRHIAVYRKWFDENAPRFECSDPFMEKAWKYRWFLVRHSMVRPGAPPLTAPVFYGGLCGERLPGVLTGTAPFILTETRWLRDARFAAGQVRAFLRTPFEDGSFADLRAGGPMEPRGFDWIPAAAVGVFAVHGSIQYLKEVLGLLARSVDAAGKPALLERPGCAACLHASCAALAEGYAALGERDRAAFYRRQAERIRAAALSTLRDEETGAFRAAAEEGGAAVPWGGAEAVLPFALGLEPPGEVQAGTLKAMARVSRSLPARPPAASLAALALARAASAGCEGGGQGVGGGGAAKEAEGLFEEALEALTAALFEGGDLSRPLLWEFPGKNPGKGASGCPDAFESFYNDLIIRFVAGLRPSPGNALILEPLVHTLDRLRLSRLKYHGHDVEILWVRPGTKNPWPGRPEGYTVVVDGETAAHAPRLAAMTVELD